MVWTAVEYTAKKGDPKSVTDAIWTFAKHYRRIMVIGEEKGGQIDAVLLKHKPKIMYELGCFVGYSAVRFGALLRQWGGKFYSFEIDAQSVEVSRKIVEHAGLQDTVEVSVYKKRRGGSKRQQTQN
jgi:catechol O-methyltransferase